MASGYEKSPDYGGPEGTWWGTLLLVLFIAMLAVVLIHFG
jgi:hypothetical protein